MISRKIWMIEKLCNFHTVLIQLDFFIEINWLFAEWKKKEGAKRP